MNPAPHRLALLMLGAFAFAACDSGGDDGIDPADANAVTDALVFVADAQQIRGSAPSPTSDPESPDIVDAASSVSVEPGGQAALFVEVDGDRPISGFYLQVTGADSYFDVEYDGAPVAEGTAALPFALPDDVEEGVFFLEYCVYVEGEDGELISNIASTRVNVRFRGEGEGEVTVTGALTSSFEGPAYAFLDTSQDEPFLFVYVFDEPIGASSQDEFVLLLVSNPQANTTTRIGTVDDDRIAGASYSDASSTGGLFVTGESGTVSLDAYSDASVTGRFDVEGAAFRFTNDGSETEELGAARFRGSFDVEISDDGLFGLRLPEHALPRQAARALLESR